MKTKTINFDLEMSDDLLEENNKLAVKNRIVFNEHNIFAVDIMGSVGAGKTSLIKALIKKLKLKYSIAAIAGDLTTTIDADRIKKEGALVIQLNTGKACHLDANLIRQALKKISLNKIDILFIENVGNLICPAEFFLGAHKRIVVISTTEGPYMIKKHPYTFMNADILVINKTDLASAMKVNMNELEKDALKIKPALKIIKTNCITGTGVDNLISALNIAISW